jgi:hypothetical protein
MKRWLRRLLYLLIVVVWLVVMSFPALAFFLATKGEVRLGGEDSYVRLFLVREEGSEGVSVEWARPSGQAAGCIQSRVVYLLWEGRGDNVTYCQCRDRSTGATLSAVQGRCNEP